MKIHTIGGYNEVGKNMTALEIGDDVLLFDSGIFLPAIVGVTEKEKIPTEAGMRQLGALPDDIYLDKKNLREKVRAILISHAHLDHLGALPYNAYRYKANILGTPFSTEVLKQILDESAHKFSNRIIPIHPNSSYIVKGKKDYKVEFINMTHSTIQTALIAVHTPEGVVIYANDFKLDNSPIFGDKPNYKRLRELSRIGVKALIVDSLYAPDDRKTPSEKIAKGLLEDVFFTTDNRNVGMIVTTFSSHIARLKTIAELGAKLHRKVVFIGRSLNKYVTAASNISLAPFKKHIQLLTFRNHIERTLKHINSHKRDYLVVCTGHQGEPGSVLDRISKNQLPLRPSLNDQIIFSSKTIPTPINEATRGELEKRLRHHKVRIFDNVHVSILPDTQVVLNDSGGMKIKEIGKIENEELREIKVPSFDPSDLKIKWYDAKLVKHPYKGKIFKIETKSGRNVSITSGHSLFKLDKAGVIAEKGDNLKEGDFLAIPRKFSWHKTISEINIEDYLKFEGNNFMKKDNMLYYNKIPISNLKISLTKEFARLLGYYLAEGSAPRHLSFVISKKENDLLEEIKTFAEKCFPQKVHVVEKETSYEIYFGGENLQKLFKCWFGENAKTKKIPKFVFSADENFKFNFLGAYINGEGHIENKKDFLRIRMKTASKKLASDILYLFTQVGICAKFDHLQINPARKIAGSKKETGQTRAYVIRIQNKEYLSILKDFLSDKFRLEISARAENMKFSQQFPPESLPVKILNLDEIEPKKSTYLFDIKNYNERCKKKKLFISRNLLAKQADSISGFTAAILNGDLLFDPITKIDASDYEGEVYDFSVPGPENFIGGFGGIMLHNSGHGGREDIRDLILLLKPEHVIPSHGDLKKLTAAAELAQEMGYKLNKNVHLMQNGQALSL